MIEVARFSILFDTRDGNLTLAQEDAISEVMNKVETILKIEAGREHVGLTVTVRDY